MEKMVYNLSVIWGYSSADRALRWQRRGPGFESLYLHQIEKQTLGNHLGFFRARPPAAGRTLVNFCF